ncbi:hypothetical protein FRC07_008091 [Ceratobasidium sp. 392]|nr:hypothetical protein FRC07_008091 [Ceratobasidium sp. 392]
MLFSIPTFVTVSALRILSIFVPQGTCSQMLFLAPLSATNVQGDAPCNPSIAELISGRIVSGAELTFQLSSHTDWMLYTAPLGSYVWDSCPYLRDITGKALSYARYTGSTVRRAFYAPDFEASTELAIVPTLVRPPGCWSNDHEVTLEWLGISFSFLALPAPAPVLSLPAPVPLLTLPAPAPVLALPSPDDSRPDDSSLVLFLGFTWRKITSGGGKFGLAILLHLLLVLQLVGRPRYEIAADYSAVEDASSVSRSQYTDSFDGLALNSDWISTHGRLKGLAPDLFKLTDQALTVEATPSSPLVEYAEDHGTVEEHEDSEVGSGLDYLDPFDGLDFGALWIPPTRAHLGGLAADLFRQVNKLSVDEPATSSPSIMDYAVEKEEEDVTEPEAIIIGGEERGKPEVEDQSEVGTVALKTEQVKPNNAVDIQLEVPQDVVDPLGGKDGSLDYPLGSSPDELLAPNVQPSSSTLEQPEVLLESSTMDSSVVAAVAVDKRETRSGRRAHAWRNRSSAVETPASSIGLSDGRGTRSTRNNGRGNGTDDQERVGRGSEGKGGRSEGSGIGRGEAAEGSRGTGGASTQAAPGSREVGGSGNLGNGSQGADNRQRGSGSGEQNDGRRGEAGIRRAPLNTDFVRRLLQQSANAERK